MAKLYFRYGAMNASKTLNLLSVAHNYKEHNKRILIVKPKLDTRDLVDGKPIIKTRAGLSRDVDILMEDHTIISKELLEDVICILVDESQFLSKNNIDHLRHIATYSNIPVICYGLKTDFNTNLFVGSKRLLEVADSIEEIKTICVFCNKKAIFNKLKEKEVKKSITENEGVIKLGAEDIYCSVCSFHYYS